MLSGNERNHRPSGVCLNILTTTLSFYTGNDLFMLLDELLSVAAVRLVGVGI